MKPPPKLKRQRDAARKALRALIRTLESCDTSAGFSWTKRDRGEFLRMAEIRK